MAKDRVDTALAARVGRLAGLLEPARLTEIVDVGANPTELPVYMPMIEARCARVTGFEPQQSAFDALADRQGTHERYLPYAVGDGSRGELKVCRSGGFTSFYEPDPTIGTYIDKARWHRLLEVVERVDVDTRRLDDMTEIDRIDLLKIDIQGGEVAVFENGRDRMAGTMAVITEAAFVPIYHDQPLFDAQMRELGAQGFVLHSLMSLQQARLRGARDLPTAAQQGPKQMIDGDALFLRDPRALDRLEDEALKHYALLADGALGLPDLAMRCLTELAARDTALAGLPAAYAALFAAET